MGSEVAGDKQAALAQRSAEARCSAAPAHEMSAFRVCPMQKGAPDGGRICLFHLRCLKQDHGEDSWDA